MPFPPVTPTVAAPVEAPLQFTLVWDELVVTKSANCVMVNVTSPSSAQPRPSTTLTV